VQITINHEFTYTGNQLKCNSYFLWWVGNIKCYFKTIGSIGSEKVWMCGIAQG
jgi:hypothetical protein